MRIKYLFVSLITFFSIQNLSYSQSLDTLNIYYSIDSSGIEDEFKNDINNLLKIDIDEIKIYSYTDFLGPAYYNKNLSNYRAAQIRTYLISKGVDASLITVCEGKGVFPNSSKDDRTNPDDRGVVRHRVSKVIFIFAEDLPVKSVEANIPITGEEENIVVSIFTDTVGGDPVIAEDEVVIPIFTNLTEENLVVGSNIILDNILFEGGTPIFKRGSETALRQLFIAMKEHPDLVIEIQGHICCQYDGGDGWDRVNQNSYLSQNRAKAVYDYLIEKGIDADRMSYVGFGSKYKRFPEEITSREEDLNRRVEIRIVDK